jgi:hypothetical protein
MQECIERGKPTLAVQLPHTVDTAATWTPAWNRFVARSGGSLRSAASAIRHSGRDWKGHRNPPDAKLLTRLARGQTPLDILVGGAD